MPKAFRIKLELLDSETENPSVENPSNWDLIGSWHVSFLLEGNAELRGSSDEFQRVFEPNCLPLLWAAQDLLGIKRDDENEFEEGVV